MVATTPEATPPKKPNRFLPRADKLRDTLTAYTFILPAFLIIFVFGLFPIGYSVYMSTFNWRILPRYTYCLPSQMEEWNELPNRDSQGRDRTVTITKVWEYDFSTEIAPNFSPAGCLENYTDIIGDYAGLGLFLGGFAFILLAWWLWNRAFTLPPPSKRKPGTREISPLLKLLFAFAVLTIAVTMISFGWNRMVDMSGNEDFLEGLIYTVYYAVGSIPLQLALGLTLAYVLYRNIWGKEMWRIIFFLPYITPAVAAATVFRIIFNPRETALANQILTTFNIEPLKWIQDPRPISDVLGVDMLWQTVFGHDLSAFMSGPSIALISVILLGIWTYVGYNAVIFLAGLGNIPGDLYEAARVDGASEWHLFRNITLPLLSPVTFYLTILGFIGTFQAFNTLFVMRESQALGTTDTASVVTFLTFRQASQYGEATAQAVILLLIILAITQLQRTVLEKYVFYG